MSSCMQGFSSKHQQLGSAHHLAAQPKLLITSCEQSWIQKALEMAVTAVMQQVIS